MKRLWAAADALMFLAFALSVAVQLNDPDRLRWMLIYGAAAAACLLSLLHRLRWWLPAAIGIVALAWAATIAPRVLRKVPFGEMFGAWEMKSPGIEESREMYGLLIVAVWMGILVLRSRRRSAQRA